MTRVFLTHTHPYYYYTTWIQVENVVEGRDIDLQLRREDFQALVSEEVGRFRALLQEALEAAGVGAGRELAAIEITGGAMRMPLLQEVNTGSYTG